MHCTEIENGREREAERETVEYINQFETNAVDIIPCFKKKETQRATDVCEIEIKISIESKTAK